MQRATCALPAKSWLQLGMLSLLAGILGCGFSSRVPVQPVAGQLFWQGKPMDQAVIMFHAVSELALLPRACTDEEGRFRLTTYDEYDGAPLGEYIVTIEWPSRLPHPDGGNARPLVGPDQLNGKYADPQTSSLKVQITPGQTQLPPILLP